jgi:hypothetical protein
MEIIDYRLYYQLPNVCEKFIEFNRDSDEDAIKYSKAFCNNHDAKLIKLEKITIKKLRIGKENKNG